jgi:hypothetical protein
MDGEFSSSVGLLPAQGLTEMAQKQITTKGETLLPILNSK